MPQVAIRESAPQPPPDQRHRPEQILLYQIVDRYYPEFRDEMGTQGKPLPTHVQQEFSEYLKCSRQEYGFLRIQCTNCHHERLVKMEDKELSTLR
jgi:DNA-directed RNA polymerase subunit RPC12/RpoP